jgi:hypothetical protein
MRIEALVAFKPCRACEAFDSQVLTNQVDLRAGERYLLVIFVAYNTPKVLFLAIYVLKNPPNNGHRPIRLSSLLVHFKLPKQAHG